MRLAVPALRAEIITRRTHSEIAVLSCRRNVLLSRRTHRNSDTDKNTRRASGLQLQDAVLAGDPQAPALGPGARSGFPVGDAVEFDVQREQGLSYAAAELYIQLTVLSSVPSWQRSSALRRN